MMLIPPSFQTHITLFAACTRLTLMHVAFASPAPNSWSYSSSYQSVENESLCYSVTSQLVHDLEWSKEQPSTSGPSNSPIMREQMASQLHHMLFNLLPKEFKQHKSRSTIIYNPSVAKKQQVTRQAVFAAQE